MARKSVLDKDFSSLFDDNMFDEVESTQTLRLSELEPNKNQPRKNFDMEALRTLSESIKENGVLQPLLVRPLPSGNYQIVAGERRWRASKMAGLDEVPVLIKELTDQQTVQIGLIENLQRENLNPIEESLGYKELIDSYNMTQDEVSRVVGKARSSITNSLRLLVLPNEVKELLRKGTLSAGHAKALLSLNDAEKQILFANKAVDEEISVRALEKAIQNLDKAQTPTKEKPKSTFFQEVELSLSNSLGVPVNIVGGKKKKTLQIEFYDDEDLKKVIKKLSK